MSVNNMKNIVDRELNSTLNKVAKEIVHLTEEVIDRLNIHPATETKIRNELSDLTAGVGDRFLLAQRNINSLIHEDVKSKPKPIVREVEW